MESEAESELTMARQLISLAQRQGVDLASMYDSGTFLHDGRIIWFWRKEGKVHYSIQGPVEILPERYQAAASHFNGIWAEAGSVAGIWSRRTSFSRRG